MDTYYSNNEQNRGIWDVDLQDNTQFSGPALQQMRKFLSFKQGERNTSGSKNP